MASYPDGTIFDQPMQFDSESTFGKGCVFQPGTIFNNPCILDEGCTGGPVQFRLYDDKLPPSVTGNGCIWTCGSYFDYVVIGPANVACDPIYWNPTAVGPNTIVGTGNNDNESNPQQSDDCMGHEVVDTAGVNQRYDFCSKICGDGIVAGNATVVDSSRCIGE